MYPVDCFRAAEKMADRPTHGSWTNGDAANVNDIRIEYFS